MITWKKEEENEIRLAAARIIARLSHHDSNRFRIVAIPGALEGITSLLVSQNEGVGEARLQGKELAFKEVKLLGLHILKNLAEENTNRVRIAEIHSLRSFPLVIALINQDEFFAVEFKTADMETHLQKILETTSEVENFYTFSGTLGLNRHTKTMDRRSLWR
ncbi:hypothetical protein O6H91_09G101500 [Diphasiastrum complanatum]|uniref:Uncharacterized protein n=1 Tax=Diphasiastrum complanatum TaxID=34168 RepID=A0ACC2CSG4_DIPCM|nr:hypothetical protein O6H91_09G101500 [Diphasiastrum complanatum]